MDYDHKVLDLVKELVNRLLNSPSDLPHSNPHNTHQQSLKYALRILSSRITPSIAADEAAMAESSKRQLSAQGSNGWCHGGGKSINFLRVCCKDRSWADAAAEAAAVPGTNTSRGGLGYGETDALESLVTEAARRIDKHLMDVVYRQYKFKEHCLAIKRYLLLGQGDFVQYLMDQLGPNSRSLLIQSARSHADRRKVAIPLQGSFFVV